MAGVDSNLMTQADYARHRDCSREAVRKAVESGRISSFGDDKRVDRDLADVQWARNTRARVKPVTMRSSSNTATAPAAPSTQTANLPGPADLPPSDTTTAERPQTYEEARRRRELAEAHLAELKLAEQQADLIRVATVRTAVARLAAGLRDSLMQIPGRLAPVLAAESSQTAVHDHLVAELRQVLEQVTAPALLNRAPTD